METIQKTLWHGVVRVLPYKEQLHFHVEAASFEEAIECLKTVASQHAPVSSKSVARNRVEIDSIGFVMSFYSVV